MHSFVIVNLNQQLTGFLQYQFFMSFLASPTTLNPYQIINSTHILTMKNKISKNNQFYF